MTQRSATPADLVGERALAVAQQVTYLDTTCAVCGATPGKLCYGNGTMQFPHVGRERKALQEMLARALLWIDEARGTLAGANANQWDGPTTRLDLERVLAADPAQKIRDANS